VPAESALEPPTWVLLSYRIPRKPGTPRVTIWRKLKRLGVAQLGDGLVALPATERTREHLDGIAQDIIEAGRTAGVWLAHSATETQDRELAAGLTAARSQEYQRVIDQAAAAATASDPGRSRILRRLRDELQAVYRRDYFPSAERNGCPRCSGNAGLFHTGDAAARTRVNLSDSRDVPGRLVSAESNDRGPRKPRLLWAAGVLVGDVGNRQVGCGFR
jgi:hypothetical protein